MGTFPCGPWSATGDSRSAPYVRTAAGHSAVCAGSSRVSDSMSSTRAAARYPPPDHTHQSDRPRNWARPKLTISIAALMLAAFGGAVVQTAKGWPRQTARRAIPTPAPGPATCSTSRAMAWRCSTSEVIFRLNCGSGVFPRCSTTAAAIPSSLGSPVPAGTSASSLPEDRYPVS